MIVRKGYVYFIFFLKKKRKEEVILGVLTVVITQRVYSMHT
jgi:hypothetical protein